VIFIGNEKRVKVSIININIKKKARNTLKDKVENYIEILEYVLRFYE